MQHRGLSDLVFTSSEFYLAVENDGDQPRYEFYNKQQQQSQQRYRVRFEKIYESDSSGDKIGESDISLNSLDWVTTDVTTNGGPITFWFNATDPDPDPQDKRFQKIAIKNVLQGTALKFDVYVEGWVWTQDKGAAYLDLEWRLRRGDDDSIDDPYKKNSTAACYDESTADVCFTIDPTAVATNSAGVKSNVNVQVIYEGPDDEDDIIIRYSRYEGDLAHDPKFGFGLSGKTKTTTTPKFPWCFSGHNLVDVKNQGPTRMDQLQVGDFVRTEDGTYSKVYSFGHYAPHAEAEFLQIRAQPNTNNQKTSSSILSLEITPNHLLYKMIVQPEEGRSHKELVAARDIGVGDLLVTSHGQHAVVVSVGTVQRQGYFSPLTHSGDLMVSGIQASSYVMLDWIQPYVSSNNQFLFYYQHVGTLPLRAYCRMFSKACQHEAYHPTTGFNKWVHFWYTVEQALLSLNVGTIVRLVLLGVVTVLYSFGTMSKKKKSLLSLFNKWYSVPRVLGK